MSHFDMDMMAIMGLILLVGGVSVTFLKEMVVPIVGLFSLLVMVAKVACACCPNCCCSVIKLRLIASSLFASSTTCMFINKCSGMVCVTHVSEGIAIVVLRKIN